MTLPLMAVVTGLALLAWGADKFVDGSVGIARHFSVSPLIIGMVIIGFGTSVPEIVFAAFSAAQGNVGLALGAAYGSNISNIALILGVAALVSPIFVQSGILKKELPILAGVTALAAYQLLDGELSRPDGWVLLGVFVTLLVWTIRVGLRERTDPFGRETADGFAEHVAPLGKALTLLIVGFLALVGSSRILVWGAVVVAEGLGVSDVLIGLTVVAFGTSLPELASVVAASRKGEDDLAVGNVLGSNLFNTLAVVGLAAVIRPTSVEPEIIFRDLPVMGALTLSLFVFGYGFRRPGRINRVEAAALLTSYLAYTGFLIVSSFLAF